MSQLKQSRSRVLFLIILVIASVPVIFPLFNHGFFISDDGEWMIIRFSAFHQALSDGQFPVRFLGRLNYGYGYPVANFLYPGYLYLTEPIHLLGFGFVDSIKIFVGFVMVGSAVFTFLWLRKFFSSLLSLVGSLVYLYMPYHLYDLFKRGSVGELLALSIAPFILWQIGRKSYFFTTIGIALLILSHNTLALLFLPTILFYMLINIRFNKDFRPLIYRYISVLFIAFGLTSFFWIPAILELPHTKFSETTVSEWRIYFANPHLLIFGSLIVIVSIFFALFRYRKWKETELNNYAFLFMGTGLLSIFMSHSLSTFLWNVLPVSFVQFPYRFISLLIPSSAFLSAYLVSEFKLKKSILFSLILLVVLCINAYPYLKVSGFLPQAEGLYATNENSTTVKNEYMPVWVLEDPNSHPESKIEGISYDNLNYNNSSISFNALSNGKVIINTIYYPGWKAFINDEEVPINYVENNGLLGINIKENPAKVTFLFTETRLRLFSNIISAISIIVLFILSTYYRKNYKNKIVKTDQNL